MSDIKVNTTGDNTAAYTAGAAAGGAIGGGAAGYFVKHYLKDGELSDKFVKTAVERFSKELEAGIQADPSEFTEIKNYISSQLNNFLDSTKKLPDYNPGAVISSEDKNMLSAILKEFGFSKSTVEKIFENTNTLGDLSDSLGDKFVNSHLEEVYRKIKVSSFWNSAAKQFVNSEEGLGKNIKDLANSTQLKAAGIYAAVAAAVLGIGTYIFTSKKNDAQSVQPLQATTTVTPSDNNVKLDKLKKSMEQNTAKTDTK